MKSLLTLFTICLFTKLTASAQLFVFGAQTGSNYCRYELSEKSSAIDLVSGSVGFHSGLWCRYDFESFFIGADINYTSTIGGTITDGISDFTVRTGSVNLPLMAGKKYWPGIRLYVGAMPTVYIKTNEFELLSFFEESPLMGTAIGAGQLRNDFIFFIMGGFELELSKFILGLRYEHPLDYIYRENFSTGGDSSSRDNYHYVSQVTLTVGYRFN